MICEFQSSPNTPNYASERSPEFLLTSSGSYYILVDIENDSEDRMIWLLKGAIRIMTVKEYKKFLKKNLISSIQAPFLEYLEQGIRYLKKKKELSIAFGTDIN